MKTGNEFLVIYEHVNQAGRRKIRRFGWTRGMASTQKFVQSQLHNPGVENLELYARVVTELNPLAFIGVQQNVEILVEEDPGQKVCEIINDKFSYILSVDNARIPFQGGNIDYFKKHYEQLGYKVIEIKADTDD